jgi:class 3 adenylate cyclase
MTQEKTNMAVLFADVSDSTKLYESIGDTAAFSNVREVVGLLKGITEAYQGRVVKTCFPRQMAPPAPLAKCSARSRSAPR